MTIRSIRAYRRELALKRPYTISRQTFTSAENVFVEVELSNGIVGIGSANTDPDVVAETPAMTLENLQSEPIATLVGRDIDSFPALIGEVGHAFPNRPGTLAAIDIALHDAYGQHAGVPVVDLYGRHHERMLTSVTIGIKDVAETIEEAREYRDRGFRALKVKTGRDCDLDAERIIKLREAFGAHFVIRIDANAGYDLAQLQRFLDLTRDQSIELIEQPLPAGQDEQLLNLSEQTRAILTADESLRDARSALTLAQQRTYGIFNIKLMKCGGISAAREIATIAEPRGIQLFWGCNDESVASITAALHAAFSCPHTRYLDLDGSLDLAEDRVTGGFVLEDGVVRPVAAPGLGLTRT